MYNPFDEDILTLQKRAISHSVWDLFGSAALFLAMCGGLLAAGLTSEDGQRFFIIMLICLIPAVCFLINGIRRLKLRKQIMDIEKSDVQDIQITCRKVRFLLHPKNKQHYQITALLLMNEYGDVYTHVFPIDNEPLDTEKKPIRQHLEDQNVTLQCYCGTRIIKSLNLPENLR